MIGRQLEYAESLPAEWEVASVGDIGTYLNGFAFKPEHWGTEGDPIIRIQNLNDHNKPFNYYDGEVPEKYRIRNGDILVSWSASLGTFRWNRGNAWLNQHIFKATPNLSSVSDEFFYWVMVHAIERIAGNARGSTMKHVTGKEFKGSEVALPPLPEQKKIAHILSTVQRAIEAQERIIQTTTELKKALMHKLFTEGLRNEPQKQTEIGPVPESWEVVPLGKYARVLNGYAFKSADYVPDGVRLIRISNVSIGYLIDKDDKCLPASYLQERSAYALKEGDLVLSLTRPIIKEGMKYCFIEKQHLPALLNQRVGRFEITDKRLRKDFLFQIIFSPYFINPLKYMAEGSNQPNVSPTRLEAFQIPIPTDIDEQEEIAKLLTGLNRKMELAKQKGAQLQDLFRTLLHELMTAKIRTA